MAKKLIRIIVNSKAGTAMSAGKQRLCDLLDSLPADQFEYSIVEPDALTDALTQAFRADTVDAVVVGGGDGTVSQAAGLAIEYDKTLGILPLGTMNLFAHAIAMPLDIEEAIRALPTMQRSRVDVGTVDGRVFLNHVSVGLHPQFVAIRDRLPRSGRLSKIFNGLKAFATLLGRVKPVRLRFKGDFQPFRSNAVLAMVFVNPIPDELGKLPINPGQNEGQLALYLSDAKHDLDLIGMTASAALGYWNSSPHLQRQVSRRIVIEAKSKLHLSIDGELTRSASPVRCSIVPLALKVLKPA